MVVVESADKHIYKIWDLLGGIEDDIQAFCECPVKRSGVMAELTLASKLLMNHWFKCILDNVIIMCIAYSSSFECR